MCGNTTHRGGCIIIRNHVGLPEARSPWEPTLGDIRSCLTGVSEPGRSCCSILFRRSAEYEGEARKEARVETRLEGVCSRVWWEDRASDSRRTHDDEE